MASLNFMGKALGNTGEILNKIKKTEKNAKDGGVSLSPGELKKKNAELIAEKSKQYGFLGIEAFELMKGRNDIPESLVPYINRLNALDKEIDEIEEAIRQKEEEIKMNKGAYVCECGYKAKKGVKFCPQCGKRILGPTLTCNCGKEVQRTLKFCPECGYSIEDLIKAEKGEIMAEEREEKTEKVEWKLCICGAKVAPGQFMCMECGRKLEGND